MLFFCDRLANPGISLRWLYVAIALIAIGPISSPVQAETFDGPNFRRGMWHFVRTLELVLHQKTKHRLQEREMTRCVDPTLAMKATFSSPSVGNCVSARPERSGNKYTFSHRCDYMGPVSTKALATGRPSRKYTEGTQNYLASKRDRYDPWKANVRRPVRAAAGLGSTRRASGPFTWVRSRLRVTRSRSLTRSSVVARSTVLSAVSTGL
jgi:hypothetical protein